MTDRLSGLEIDDQLEFCRPLDRQISGSDAAQNLHELPAQQISKELEETRTIPDEASLLCHFRPLVNRWQAQRCSALHDNLAIGEEERRGQDVECTGIRRLRGIDRRRDLLGLGDLMNR